VSRFRRQPCAEPATDASVVGIAAAPSRTPVRVCGQITRMQARPTSGLPTLVVSLSDATGTATAVWTGRRAIGGITLGRTLVIEGVAVQRRSGLEFTNPAYTLSPQQ
jgi:hypothetical protein